MPEETQTKPLCHEDCWHYNVFGGVEGCGKQESENGNPWPEPIEPGEKCFYPKKRDIVKPIYIGSVQGLCAALEGTVIEGGPNDNTSIVKLLTNPKDSSE